MSLASCDKLPKEMAQSSLEVVVAAVNMKISVEIPVAFFFGICSQM
jgi:hypothetical protein